MTRRPQISTRPVTLFPYATRFRSAQLAEQDRDLVELRLLGRPPAPLAGDDLVHLGAHGVAAHQDRLQDALLPDGLDQRAHLLVVEAAPRLEAAGRELPDRSEEHTSELQSLMRTSYAVFCLKK